MLPGMGTSPEVDILPVISGKEGTYRRDPYATAAHPAHASVLLSLAPGDYVVCGVVRLEDRAISRVVRTLRKVAR